MQKSDCNTYLTTRGYIIRKKSLTPRRETKLRSSLTVMPFEKQQHIMSNYGAVPTKFPLFLENPAKYYVPRFWGIENYGIPDRNELYNHGEDIGISFGGSLRPKQQTILDQYIPALEEKGGGILNLGCAQGKTVMALYTLCHFKKKTLVVVHKSFLMDQWIERIKQFIPTARIGIIRASKTQVEDVDIVIAMLQSISTKTYEPNVFSSFGMTIVDECHHAAAEVFSRAFTKISTRYMMGLSATLDRKDGLRKVFEWYLGPAVPIKLPEGESSSQGRVCVKMIKFLDPEYQVPTTNARGTLNLPKMINILVESPKRNQIVLDIIRKLSKNENRHILVLSERRGHLNHMAKLLLEKLNMESGMYVGGESQEKLKASEKKQVIFGTYHMISEGFDLPTLNTLIYASPKSDVIQASGRILRQLPEDRKCVPCIIDIWDSCVSLDRKGDQRRKFYKKSKFEITTKDTQDTQDTQDIEYPKYLECLDDLDDDQLE